jgi:peptide deformylase
VNATKEHVYIRYGGDPVLSVYCDPITQAEALEVCDLMRRALRQSKNGVGLAAPQIGIAKRACVIWHRRQSGECIRMANPVLVAHSETMNEDREGCLSYPGVFVPIVRYDWVSVEWRDVETWVVQRQHFQGFQGRVVQHEIDHLSGVCRVGIPNGI